MKDQEEEFNQAGNPDYDHVIGMKKCMHIKLELFRRELKETLLKEVSNNKRLNLVMNKNRYYAGKVINEESPWGNTSYAGGNHGLPHNNEGSQK